MFNKVSKVVIHNEPVGWCETCAIRGITPLERNGRVILDHMLTVQDDYRRYALGDWSAVTGRHDIDD